VSAEVSSYREEEALTAREVLVALRASWVSSLGAITVCLVGAAAFAWLLKPVYRSEVVLAPVSEESTDATLAGIAGQLGGLATLAGIAPPGADNTAIAVATLKSDILAEEFIRSRDLLPTLFADDWDAQQKRWAIEDPDDVPTLNDAIERFDTKVRDVFEDKESGLVTLSIEWVDREQAADWANTLVALANARLRRQSIAEAQRSIEYLRRELGKTEVVELRSAIDRLTESEIKRIMLAEVREEYAFKIIDPARAADSDDYVRPNWPMMLAAGTLMGAAVAFLLAVWRRKRRTG
jgi:uncharacterized protein involved in exopolysaccharide biosynthesis